MSDCGTFLSPCPDARHDGTLVGHQTGVDEVGAGSAGGPLVLVDEGSPI